MARSKRKARKSTKPKVDPYQEITDRMIAAIEEGTAPWQKPWKVSPYGNTPHNPVSGTVYRGVNVWLTLMTMWERNYDHPIFLTYKQATEVAVKAYRKAGVKVEKRTVKRRNGKESTFWAFADGEDKGKKVGGIQAGQNEDEGTGSTKVLFWKGGNRIVEDENGEEERRHWMMTKVYRVFNVAQCLPIVQDYLMPPVEGAPEFTPLEACERICEGYEITTKHGGDRAYYHPGEDRIQMPNREQFRSAEEYYSVRFHEMGHSTGHPTRLGREGVTPGKYREIHTYAEEELVAEFCASFLAGEAGIVRTVENNSAAYLRSWAAKLKDDPKIVVYAAQRAQKAADMVLGREAPGKAEKAEKGSASAVNSAAA